MTKTAPKTTTKTRTHSAVAQRKTATAVAALEPITAQPDPEPVETPLTPAEREEAAVRVTAETEERLRTIAARLGAIASEVVALDTRTGEAQQLAIKAQAAADALPGQIAAARARLLILSGRPGEAGGKAAVEQLEQMQRDAQAGAAAARTEAEQIAAEVAAQRATLEAERDQLAAEQRDLASLIDHLRREVAAAKDAQGDELLADGLRVVTRAVQTVERTEQAAAEWRDHLDRVRSFHLNVLRPYPAALAKAQGTLLEAPTAPTPTERLLTAWIEYLDVFAQVQGSITTAQGTQPLWHVLTSGSDAIPFALNGQNLSYAPNKRQQAATWLASYRQNRRQSAGSSAASMSVGPRQGETDEHGVTWGFRVEGGPDD